MVHTKNILQQLSSTQPAINLCNLWVESTDVYEYGDRILSTDSIESIWKLFINELLINKDISPKIESDLLHKNYFEQNEIFLVNIIKYFWIDTAPLMNEINSTVKSKIKSRGGSKYSLIINDSVEINFEIKSSNEEKRTFLSLFPLFFKEENGKQYPTSVTYTELLKLSRTKPNCICGNRKNNFKTCCYKNLFYTNLKSGATFGFIALDWEELKKNYAFFEYYLNKYNRGFEYELNKFISSKYIFNKVGSLFSLKEDLKKLKYFIKIPSFDDYSPHNASELVEQIEKVYKNYFNLPYVQIIWVHKEDGIVIHISDSLNEKQTQIRQWFELDLLNKYLFNYCKFFTRLANFYTPEMVASYYIEEFSKRKFPHNFSKSIKAAFMLHESYFNRQASTLVYSLFEPIIRIYASSKNIDILTYDFKNKGYKYKTLGELFSDLRLKEEIDKPLMIILKTTLTKEGQTYNLNLRNKLMHGLAVEEISIREFYISLILLFFVLELL